jgi:hemerythrin
MHFAEEEKLMEENHCPTAMLNKEQHLIFINKISAFKTRFEVENASVSLTIAVVHELTDWIINHIMKVDIKLKECIK